MTKRLLIIEDHVDVRRLIRMVLEFEGYDIHEAGDGPSGLAAARQLQPDLVLLDVMMPEGEDGFAVCREMRSDPALHTTRIVLLTARDRGEDREQGMNAGANAYLVKPFSPLQLIDVVKGQWAVPGPQGVAR